LGVRNARVGGRFGTQEIVLKLIHARIGKHEGRIIFYHYRGTWYNLVGFGSKKVEKSLSDS
jgi:predicted Rossmann-fold nucleotide-binding protein